MSGKPADFPNKSSKKIGLRDSRVSSLSFEKLVFHSVEFFRMLDP